MTWKDIKIATLQKIYSISGNTIIQDEGTNDYIKAMPYACNEALQLLSTAGKYITKKIEIAVNPIPNLLPPNTRNIVQHFKDDIEYLADGAKAYTFDIVGNATVMIYVGDVLQETVEFQQTTPNKFENYKGLIQNLENKPVRIVFTGEYAFAINNVALYGISFLKIEDIPEFSLQTKYKLRKLTDDFYRIKSENVIFEGNYSDETYKATEDYYFEGNDTIVIQRERIGNYTIYYYAYPPEITSLTADDYILPIDGEIAVLLPLYIASQIYKDDDIALSTVYRNEFEVAREALQDFVITGGKEQFTSVSGWVDG